MILIPCTDRLPLCCLQTDPWISIRPLLTLLHSVHPHRPARPHCLPSSAPSLSRPAWTTRASCRGRAAGPQTLPVLDGPVLGVTPHTGQRAWHLQERPMPRGCRPSPAAGAGAPHLVSGAPPAVCPLLQVTQTADLEQQHGIVE